LQLGQNTSATEPLVEVIRGKVVEAVHRGALAVVDRKGHLSAWVGNPDLVVTMRSSAKPFQLLPLIESGAADQWDLNEQQLAVIAGSHSGSDAHVATVRSILKRIGLDQDALLCGTHRPLDHQAAAALICADAPPTSLHHNCSGKHAGMLAYAVSQGWSTENYTDPEHPIQVKILETLAEMAEMAVNQIEIGIDGCSVPVFGLPLRHAAWAYARLLDPSDLAASRQKACRRIVSAMTAHPEMVAGTDRLDTHLMQAAPGRVVSKGGAEGYQGLAAWLEDQSGHSIALGLALKIEDGNGRRGTPLATLETLRQLGVLEKLTPEALATLADFDRRPLYNYRHLPVGELRQVFALRALSTARRFLQG